MSSILQIKDANGNWVPIPAITGPKGDTGEKGDKGDTGPKGDPGDMAVSVYDPQGKAQDIFAYVDAAILGAIEGSY